MGTIQCTLQLGITLNIVNVTFNSLTKLHEHRRVQTATKVGLHLSMREMLYAYSALFDRETKAEVLTNAWSDRKK